MATKASKTTARTRQPAKARTTKNTVGKKDTDKSYNGFKSFDGQQYTGMQVGRSHKWNYDQGEWRETKITPDLWEMSYAVKKRRAGRAPEGSGAPVGTGYHWYILAHQYVTKLNANDYSTSMSGLKFKLAHKRADKEKWSLSGPTQRKHLIKILQDMITELEQVPIPLQLEYKGENYKGEAIPIMATCNEECYELDIMLNDESLGIIKHAKSGWKMDNIDKGLVKAIGKEIEEFETIENE